MGAVVGVSVPSLLSHVHLAVMKKDASCSQVGKKLQFSEPHHA